METNAVSKVNTMRRRLYNDLYRMIKNSGMAFECKGKKYVLNNPISYKDKGVIKTFKVEEDSVCGDSHIIIPLEVTDLDGNILGHIYPYQLPLEELAMFYDIKIKGYYTLWESQQIF